MNQTKTRTWEIRPKDTPTVIRNCPKCGGNSEYKSSDCFRVNANQNQLDVWLIYQCKKCKSTWNMDILTRINKSQIDENLYQKFLANDKELSKQYAFDVSIHRNNKAIMSYENIEYDIIGEREIEISNVEISNIEIQLKCDYSLELRMDKLISQKLELSRETVKKMYKNNKIVIADEKNISKVKVKDGMVFTIMI